MLEEGKFSATKRILHGMPVPQEPNAFWCRTGGLGSDKPTSAAKLTWRRQGCHERQPQSEP